MKTLNDFGLLTRKSDINLRNLFLNFILMKPFVAALTRDSQKSWDDELYYKKNVLTEKKNKIIKKGGQTYVNKRYLMIKH